MIIGEGRKLHPAIQAASVRKYHTVCSLNTHTQAGRIPGSAQQCFIILASKILHQFGLIVLEGGKIHPDIQAGSSKMCWPVLYHFSYPDNKLAL